MKTTRHMTDDELTSIFRNEFKGYFLETDAFFSSHMVDIRWVVDSNHMHLCMGKIYDSLSEATMKKVAQWVMRYVSTGNEKIDRKLFERMKEEIQPNCKEYNDFMKFDRNLDASELECSVTRLIDLDMIKYSDASEVTFYWLSPKSKCIGCCSRFFDEIGVSSETMMPTVPKYVRDYIVYCNICMLKKEDWEKMSDKYPKKAQAEDWLKKHIKFKPDKNYSIPYVDIDEEERT